MSNERKTISVWKAPGILLSKLIDVVDVAGDAAIEAVSAVEKAAATAHEHTKVMHAEACQESTKELAKLAELAKSLPSPQTES